ncbi:MAG: RagB/SusD family nutrient uptake outer membrane protein [Paludibacter sp.]
MKNRINHSIPTIIIAMLVMLSACSDDFLKDKQDYSKVSEVVYNTYAGAQSRINDIYYKLLPQSAQAMTYQFPSSGVSDDYSKSTEEYGGLSKFVDNGTIISNENIDDFFYNEAKASTSPWGFIRNCNDAIWGISNGTLTEAEKKTLLGQAYFWRAWVYFRLVKLYGGVPIIEVPQLPVIGESASDLIIPRATTKECISFICKDLAIAAEYLPGAWDENNWGRVTSGTALALMGRVKLTHASPLFNRADNIERWDSAYVTTKKAVEVLEANGFGLAYNASPGVNGSGWAKMFSDTKSPEAVLVTLYNNVELAQSLAPEFWNSWESRIRPYNSIMSGGGMTATANMVDLFPMADGTRSLDINGNPINGYDPQIFFLNRDPRFYRTFAFPGVEWKFNGTPDANLKPPYSQGQNYVLWNYAWYNSTDDQTNEGKSGYGTDGLADSYRGIYIRKRTDDLGVNTTPKYISTARGFSKRCSLYGNSFC